MECVFSPSLVQSGSCGEKTKTNKWQQQNNNNDNKNKSVMFLPDGKMQAAVIMVSES